MQSIAYLVPGAGHPDTAESYDISQLLVCGYCKELRNPSGVGLETLSYVCPSCCCILGNLEAREQECRCSLCYCCPKCTLPLRPIEQGANPSHVLGAPWMIEYAKSRSVPPGLEDGKRVFEFICTSCLWRSSEIVLVSNSIRGLLENAKEIQVKTDQALQAITAANLLTLSLRPKHTDLTKQPEVVDPPPSARLSQMKRAADRRIVPANLQGLAFTTILQCSLSDARKPEALEASQSALCSSVEAVIRQKYVHGKTTKDPSQTQEKLSRLDSKNADKRWNIRAFNTLLLAYTTQLLYSSLSARMRNAYNAPHMFNETALRRAATDSFLPKNTRALDIVAGTAKGPKLRSMEDLISLLTDDACKALSYSSWDVAHTNVKPASFPCKPDDVTLQRVRLIGRRSRRCLKCDRVLTRGYNERNAESAARSFIPRMLLIRSFTKKDFFDLSESRPEIDVDPSLSDPDKILSSIHASRFPKASKKDELIVWCVINFQNLRNDEVLLRLLTDQEKSDVPTEEAVNFSDSRATLKTSSSAILEMGFAFFDPKLLRVEMKGRQVSEAEPSEKRLGELINSGASNAAVFKYIREHMSDTEVIEFLGKIEEKSAFIIASSDTMTCAAIPLGVKETAKPGDLGKFVLPGFVKTGERFTKFLAEVTLCDIVN